MRDEEDVLLLLLLLRCLAWSSYIFLLFFPLPIRSSSSEAVRFPSPVCFSSHFSPSSPPPKRMEILEGEKICPDSWDDGGEIEVTPASIFLFVW